MKDGFYDWHDVKVSKWRRVLRLILSHKWRDEIRGYTAEESARLVLIKYDKKLSTKEKKFLTEIMGAIK